eukprot:gene4074-4356_t
MNAPYLNAITEFPRRNLKIPDKIIVGYASWNQCDETLVRAVEQGVNVLIWFAINLAVNEQGEPTVTGGPNMDCVASKVKQIRELGLETIHLISIGGWNSPHPDTTNPPIDMYKAWDHWNRQIAARPDQGFYGFDGFDWDIEGNDTPSSPYNEFTVACLDLMGEMSKYAKADGYIVTMAPAESYIDPTRNGFDRSLRHEYEEWIGIIPSFPYHGLNAYAYLLNKYAKTETIVKDELTGALVSTLVPTFDWIMIQLYEGYSHAEYNITQAGEKPWDVLIKFVQLITTGWEIQYSNDQELHYPNQYLNIESDRLLIGLANGWAGDGKFLLIYPDEINIAYQQLKEMNLAPRGFGFWDIADEGKASVLRPNEPVWLASGLNKILKIRNNN